MFKVLKPHIPDFFGEDLNLLQGLGEHLGRRNRGYGFAIRDVKEMLTEVRSCSSTNWTLPERATLIEARQAYRSSIGIRVPRLVQPLCTSRITAMSEENGVKVTDAFRRWPLRRTRVAEQLVEAILAVPLFSRAQRPSFMPILMPGICSMTKPTGTDRPRLGSGGTAHPRVKAPATGPYAEDDLARSRGGLRGHPALAVREKRNVIERVVHRFFDQLPATASPGRSMPCGCSMRSPSTAFTFPLHCSCSGRFS